MSIVESFSLSVLFVGIVLSIIEAGLLVFILKGFNASRRISKNLTAMFMLTVGWGIFLILESLSHHFGYESLIIVTNAVGTIPLLVFSCILPSLWKFFNKQLLVVSGFFALCVVALSWLTYLYDVDILFHLLSVIPPLLGYSMFMEATIRTAKK